MTIQQGYKHLLYQLFGLHTDREATAICDLVIAYITGQQKIDRILNKTMPLSKLQEEQLENFTLQLLQKQPVQYVLQEAWFAGMKFFVDNSVLIPRPETEELTAWIIEEAQEIQTQNKEDDTPIRILDIGTGSGCIAITLKKKLPKASIFAIDVSEKAISVATKNALANSTYIQFSVNDILSRNNWKVLPEFDILVSNPPYIKESEAAMMDNNVKDYEPGLALFVKDEERLLFYNAISDFGLYKLRKKGKLFFEINELYGKEVSELLLEKGYKNIHLKKDVSGKDRMIMAEYPD